MRARTRSSVAETKLSPASPLEWLSRNSAWLAFLLVVLGTVRIAFTYNALSRTGDEQAHLAAGLEYWDLGRYTYELQHPPLTRIAVALLPYLDGAKSLMLRSMYEEGAKILNHSPAGYAETLTLSRVGVLPFFWLACWLVFYWTRRYFDQGTAVVALGLFTFVPAVLAHSGVATTDMGLTALCGASLLATFSLLRNPSVNAGLLWGATVGLAVTAKFSILPFYPACLLGALGMCCAGKQVDFGEAGKRVKLLVKPLAAGAVAACVVIWTIYRFSFGPAAMLGGLPVPFPELFDGIGEVIAHNRRGHPAFLLGQTSDRGFWYYYPVALAFKLPLGFLILLGTGAWLGWKRRSAAILALLGCALGVLFVGAAGNINIGIRHVLPVTIFFSLIAAYGAASGISSAVPRWRNATLVLLGWMAISSALSHPDYLAYFNELALGQPERILADSDLDWGQDLKRAEIRLRELKARFVAFRPYSLIQEDLDRFPPAADLDAARPMPGWNLVSITAWKVKRYDQPPGTPLWMDKMEPTERVGRGMFLYYFPEQSK